MPLSTTSDIISKLLLISVGLYKYLGVTPVLLCYNFVHLHKSAVPLLYLYMISTMSLSSCSPAVTKSPHTDTWLVAGHVNNTVKLDGPIQTKKYDAYRVAPYAADTEIYMNKFNHSLAYKEVDGEDPVNPCRLQLDERNIRQFRHMVFYHDLSFVLLSLKLGPGLSLTPSRKIVGEIHWVWTFYGKHGGVEFLDWPLEYQIWSLGLLNRYVGGPLDMHLNRVGGNCSALEVGTYGTDLAISRALVNLTYEMHPFRDGQYDASFLCYRERQFIKSKILYYICKHIVCPYIAIKYVCCSNYYVVEKRHREIECRGRRRVFKIDEIWWLAPVFAAVILFSFIPLFILSMTGWFKNKPNEHTTDTFTDYVFLDRTDHITLLKTFLSPISFFSERSPSCLSRIIRFFLPFFSFTVIGLQVYLDYMYFPLYVDECVAKGVPMGFRSMVSGFTKSSKNFLPGIGGPFVACIVYLITACFLSVTPQSLLHTLMSGVSVAGSGAEIVSPLCLSFPLLERYGSVPIRKRHGYTKLNAVYVAQLNLLININFWKFTNKIQVDRWKIFQTNIFRSFLLPLYLILCLAEILLCIIVYGFPIISFGITVYKGYRSLLLHSVRNRIWKPFVIIASTFLLLCIVFFLYMLFTIFLDTCLFITRVCIFTYTAIVVYPRIAYGYLIFGATVMFYLWDSIQNFSRYYFRLLRMTVSACESVQRANDVEPLIVKKQSFKGIKKSLFEEVIEQYCPRRKNVIVSFTKVAIILTIMGLSVHLLMKTDTFQDLHIIMHVATTLLICAFPRIIQSLCFRQNKKIEQQKARSEIKSIVRKSVGFMFDESDDSD